jgi:hypothetical protein
VEPALGLDAGTADLVRPYFRTHGRTRPTRTLPVEALIAATERGRTPEHACSREEAAICILCRSSQSVAEIAAYRRIPLGVVRVLVSDLADRGLVAVQDTPMASGGRPSIDFMERVLRGLHAMT